MGQGIWVSKYNGKTTKEYSLWLHMMGRCYSEKFHKENISYKNVEVCDKWKCYQNFCEDLPKIKGYENWISQSGIELDKDTVCEKLNIYPKVYSLETCIFISKKENVTESTTRKNLTGLTYIGISPNGKKYEFTNISEFALKNSLNPSLVNACLHKIRNYHKGWIFKIKE